METLQFGPEWTIVHAAELHQQLLAALQGAAETGEVPVLDLSRVEAIDSTGVQLLLAMRRTLAERGQDLQVNAASPVVRAALEVYRLDGLLIPEA